MPYSVKVEYADARRMRTHNKPWYRVAHWPIWIWVFFLAPGPLTFDLFAQAAASATSSGLAPSSCGTGIAALRGQLPGAEPAPYILRFTEDRPNPLYRRICYTFAWNALLNFALLNLAGLAIAVAHRHLVHEADLRLGYSPLCSSSSLLGVLGVLPRVGRSTKGEGMERRYFYGTVWAVTAAQTVLLILWKTLPRNHTTDIVKLAVYCAVLAAYGYRRRLRSSAANAPHSSRRTHGRRLKYRRNLLNS